jgi:hypothetical protein
MWCPRAPGTVLVMRKFGPARPRPPKPLESHVGCDPGHPSDLHPRPQPRPGRRHEARRPRHRAMTWDRNCHPSGESPL